MPKSPSTARCDSTQLKSLLALGLIDATEQGGSTGLTLRLKTVLREMGEVDGLFAEGLLDVVLDAKTDLRALQSIKEASKALDERSTTAEQREAARSVYHIALAAALARHGANLSRRRPDEQVGIYRRLAEASDDQRLTEIMRLAIEKIRPGATHSD